MKKFLFTILTCFSVFLIAGCSDSDDDGGSQSYSTFAGEYDVLYVEETYTEVDTETNEKREVTDGYNQSRAVAKINTENNKNLMFSFEGLTGVAELNGTFYTDKQDMIRFHRLEDMVKAVFSSDGSTITATLKIREEWKQNTGVLSTPDSLTSSDERKDVTIGVNNGQPVTMSETTTDYNSLQFDVQVTTEYEKSADLISVHSVIEVADNLYKLDGVKDSNATVDENGACKVTLNGIINDNKKYLVVAETTDFKTMAMLEQKVFRLPAELNMDSLKGTYSVSFFGTQVLNPRECTGFMCDFAVGLADVLYVSNDCNKAEELYPNIINAEDGTKNQCNPAEGKEGTADLLDGMLVFNNNADNKLAISSRVQLGGEAMTTFAPADKYQYTIYNPTDDFINFEGMGVTGWNYDSTNNAPSAESTDFPQSPYKITKLSDGSIKIEMTLVGKQVDVMGMAEMTVDAKTTVIMNKVNNNVNELENKIQKEF